MTVSCILFDSDTTIGREDFREKWVQAILKDK
jgi:hypothetical protein